MFNTIVHPVTISVVQDITNPIYAVSGFTGPPSASDMLVYLRSVDSTGAYLIDSKATGDYEVEPGQYLAMGTVPTITFAGMDAGVTAASHSGTATVALSSGTLSCSVAGTLYDLILSDGSVYSCGEGVSGEYIYGTHPTLGAAIEGVLVGWTLPADRQESPLFGHTWENYSVYTGEVHNGHAVNGKIPQDPNSLGFDIFGNELTNPGTPQRSAKVLGWTGAWDGTAYLAIASLVGTETVTSSTGTSNLTVSAGRIDFTAGWCSTFTLSNGYTYIVESDITSAQVQVWSNNGGPVGVLEGPATFPFFTTQIEGSLLLAGGFELVGDHYVPAGANTGTLTQKPGVLIGGGDGVELWTDPVTQTIDANNYSTYDMETGIGRIVSNGTAVNMSIPVEVAKTYMYRLSNLVGTGQIKAWQSGQLGELLNPGDTQTQRFTAIGDTFLVYRHVACNTTLKISIQEFQESPVLLEMLPNVDLSEADSVDEIWTTASTGASKQVTPTEALSTRGDNTWGGGGDNKFEIVIYNPTPDVETNAKIDTYYSRRYPN